VLEHISETDAIEWPTRIGSIARKRLNIATDHPMKALPGLFGEFWFEFDAHYLLTTGA
jgi:hypothetical protein